MKTMNVLRLDGPSDRVRYLRFGRSLGRTMMFTGVEDINEASRFNDASLFERAAPNAKGTVIQVELVLIEGKHKSAMHYLKDLLDKELAYAQEQEDTAELPEDRKDYRRDGEKIHILKELFGL